MHTPSDPRHLASHEEVEPTDVAVVRSIDADMEAETLPKSRRVIIFGSRVSGAYDICSEIDQQLADRGIDGVDAYITKNVDRIEDSFFGRTRRPISESNHSEVPTGATPSKRSLRRFLGSLVSAPATVPGLENTPGEQPVTTPTDTIPAGVLIFPEMRRYWDGGMNVDTPYKKIEDLCAQHGVPFVHVFRLENPAEIGQALTALEAHKPTE